MQPNFTKEKYLIDYLDRFYKIDNHSFYSKRCDEISYGDDILCELEIVFTFGSSLNELILRLWAISNGLSEEFFEKAYKSPWISVTASDRVGELRTMRATWSPELIEDLQHYHNIDYTTELTNMLADELAREINNDIMLNLRNNHNIHFGDLGLFNPAI